MVVGGGFVEPYVEGGKRRRSGNRRLFLHNCFEPVVGDGKAQREGGTWYVINIVRIGSLLLATPVVIYHGMSIRRDLLVGQPRPFIVEFPCMY